VSGARRVTSPRTNPPQRPDYFRVAAALVLAALARFFGAAF
jgi:hypothetical protein